MAGQGGSTYNKISAKTVVNSQRSRGGLGRYDWSRLGRQDHPYIIRE